MLGKYRNLAQCSAAAGYFLILDMEHFPTDDRLFTNKLIGSLSASSSAVLGQVQPTLHSAIVSRALSGKAGLLAPLSEDWPIHRIKQSGGTGVKLSLAYQPTAPDSQEKQDRIARLVDECNSQDIAFFLEPIVNSSSSEALIETVFTFSRLGADVLIVDFPSDKIAPKNWNVTLQNLNAACPIAWLLKDTKQTYASFYHLAQLACQNGATGVLAGQAVWQEASDQKEADTFLSTIALGRMNQLAELCETLAARWYTKTLAPTYK